MSEGRQDYAIVYDRAGWHLEFVDDLDVYLGVLADDDRVQPTVTAPPPIDAAWNAQLTAEQYRHTRLPKPDNSNGPSVRLHAEPEATIYHLPLTGVAS
jgi:hypothetical protein